MLGQDWFQPENQYTRQVNLGCNIISTHTLIPFTPLTISTKQYPPFIREHLQQTAMPLPAAFGDVFGILFVRH